MLDAPHFAMMLDMLRASDVSDALSRQKPWSEMTDDQKLVATLLFMVLYAAQLILLVPLTLLVGLAWAGDGPIGVPVRWPILLLDYAPALMGIMFAALSFTWPPIRRSGPWIWVPVVLFELRFASRQELLGRTPLDIAVNTPALACILYSATMFIMNRKVKGNAQATSP